MQQRPRGRPQLDEAPFLVLVAVAAEAELPVRAERHQVLDPFELGVKRGVELPPQGDAEIEQGGRDVQDQHGCQDAHVPEREARPHVPWTQPQFDGSFTMKPTPRIVWISFARWASSTLRRSRAM
jgi:hypothetical protein